MTFVWLKGMLSLYLYKFWMLNYNGHKVACVPITGQKLHCHEMNYPINLIYRDNLLVEINSNDLMLHLLVYFHNSYMNILLINLVGPQQEISVLSYHIEIIKSSWDLIRLVTQSIVFFQFLHISTESNFDFLYFWIPFPIPQISFTNGWEIKRCNL
jgi:hypothetical protein